MRVDAGFSTITEETAKMTGGDWERNHPQQVKEFTKRKDAGLEKAVDMTPDPDEKIEEEIANGNN